MNALNISPKVALTGFVIAAMWFVFAVAPANAQLAPAARERAEKLVVMVTGGFEGGSGTFGAGIVFARSADRLYIVTAYHVLHPRGQTVRDVKVMFRDLPGRSFPASILDQSDTGLDVSVVSVSGVEALGKLLPFDSAATVDTIDKIGPGTEVYTIGNQSGKGWTFSLRPDLVAGQDGTFLEFQTAYVAEGDSGGALVDANGDLVGMVRDHGATRARAVRADLLRLRLLSWNYPMSLAPHRPSSHVDPASSRTPSLANVRWYRHALAILSGESRQTGEVASNASGQVAEVETDEQGRTVRISSLRAGKKIGETLYHYAQGSNVPSGYEGFREGEAIVTTKIQRNQLGYRTREDHRTVEGILSSYTLYKYNGLEVDVASYSGSGERTGRVVRYFGANGVLNLERFFPQDDDAYYEREIDQTTGLTVSKKKIVSGRSEITYKLSYDPEGDLIREDLYNAGGNWFGFNEFSERLLSKKFYRFPSGETWESRIAYDRRRWPHEAKFSVNGTLVCTFRAELDPTGRVVRTLALGPSGELWAEYPDAWIIYTMRDGSASDGFKSIIHRSGKWW